ncbi:MAG: DUF1800 domain-containing protein [Bacteroidetes bacterium]|nr:DUF1800 domain-containing protein [Bacteroidota bacterium]MBS1972896.1 DUF1800 domain-containing protein [Bacteroidota bacterium]
MGNRNTTNGIFKNRSRQFFGASLDEYTGDWGTPQVVHLLKRTMFGAKIEDVNYFSSLTMPQAVDELLTETPVPSTLPLNNYNVDGYTDPTGVTAWQTWIGMGVDFADIDMNGKRVNSMRCWWMGQLLGQGRSIHEKMTLFWHNHFASDAGAHTGDIPAELWYRQYLTLRANALGNFKQMTKSVTLDPAMLIFLNGSTNKKTSPNENYGRELQELYTIGKGTGSHYTESDVQSAAKVLTGHTVDSNFNYYFDPAAHDDKSKSFSDFYSSTIITGRSGPGGANEVDDLMNMIFNTDESAKFICRKVYNFFVYYKITDDVEANIIAPLAQIFRNSGYDVKAMLSALFKSQHFFDLVNSGACVIKSPLDFLVGLCREYAVPLPAADDTASNYAVWQMLTQQSATLQQLILGIPLVAGWAPYYEAPAFHELWINSVTYTERNAFTDLIISTGDMMNMVSLAIDPLAFAQKLPDPSDPDKLIGDSLNILYRVPLTDDSKAYLKSSVLLSGQTNNYYWTQAWNNYMASPGDMIAKQTVQTRLQSLYKYLMNLPEYHLS